MRYFGKGRRKSGEMNKLEQKYFQHLLSLKHTNQILDFWFEPMNLRLAQKTYYRPDFMVLMPDLSIEIQEVKGFMMDDANVKLKVAAAKFPFKFQLVKWVKGQWDITEVKV